MRKAAAAFLIVSCGFFPVLVEAQQTTSSAERTLFESANRERKAQGLPALKWDDHLAAAARKHARLMAEHGSISHQFPEEPSMPGRATKAGAHYSSLAENVAEAPSPSALHEEWMHSPHHRANILDRDTDSLGVGVAERHGQMYAVEYFSKAR